MTEKKFWHRKFYVPSHKKSWISQKKIFFAKNNFLAPQKGAQKLPCLWRIFEKWQKNVQSYKIFGKFAQKTDTKNRMMTAFGFCSKKPHEASPLGFFAT